MGLVLVATLVFCAASLVVQVLYEKLMFLFKSNWKYRFLDWLADFIYYGPDIGVEASLALDHPSDQVLERRKKGHEYLKGQLSSKEEGTIAAKLVDCRFALEKVLMPLLRELEFPSNRRNYIRSVHHAEQENRSSTSAGMHEVVVEQNCSSKSLLYVGSDAVHTLGAKSFYEPLQKEINRRMTLEKDDQVSDSMLRFAPISLNPELEKNADLILGLTGMDQVRYCLSGSEAMDAALKDVKASCRGKNVVVRFEAAYHGHVSGVDFLNCGSNHVFLKECNQTSIDFIEKYHYRIAAVVVNPMQHFTGVNKPSPPGEKLTMGARVREATSRQEYAQWLHDLQDKCQYCTKYLSRVALIMDDVYFAFRTPELFSFRYFEHPKTGAPLQPDVIVLGKGVAAGYPLSMVLGKRGFLNSYDKKYLLQVNKTVGTMSAWYGGLVASSIFLSSLVDNNKKSLLQVSAKDQLQSMVSKFDAFTSSRNREFKIAKLPLRIKNFSNTFSVNYTSSSLYNCRFPQYLMAQGVFLSNYSTGKFNLNADATNQDLDKLQSKFVAAATRMQEDGYFEPIKYKLRLMMSLTWRFVVNILRVYYERMMEDKRIDIEVSHNHPVNKFGHFWSSVFMILLAYPYMFMGKSIEACTVFFVTHVIRQSGHFFYEHQDKDIEKLKFGHKDASKKAAVVALAMAGLVYHYRAVLLAYVKLFAVLELSVDQYVSLVALFTIVPHYVEITHQYGYLRGMEWMVKIWTDPFTDLIDFWPYCVIHPKWFLVFKDQKATYKLDPASKTVCKVE